MLISWVVCTTVYSSPFVNWLQITLAGDVPLESDSSNISLTFACFSSCFPVTGSTFEL